MGRILLVDEAPENHQTVASCLSRGTELVSASTIAEARRLLSAEEFDLVLLDVKFPDGDGFQFCASLQQQLKPVPFMFVTERSEVSDLVTAFSLGAEDYVFKPYDPRELRARVDARLRRLDKDRARDLILQVGDLKLNVPLQRAWIVTAGVEQPIELTPLEFRLLFHFAQHEGHVFTRERLLATIWSDNVNVLDRTVDMHVSNLRRKLTRSLWTIRSVHGVGYRLTRSVATPKVRKPVRAATAST